MKDDWLSLTDSVTTGTLKSVSWIRREYWSRSNSWDHESLHPFRTDYCMRGACRWLWMFFARWLQMAYALQILQKRSDVSRLTSLLPGDKPAPVRCQGMQRSAGWNVGKSLASLSEWLSCEKKVVKVHQPPPQMLPASQEHLEDELCCFKVGGRKKKEEKSQTCAKRQMFRGLWTRRQVVVAQPKQKHEDSIWEPFDN